MFKILKLNHYINQMSSEIFTVDNDDYVWLCILYGEKTVHTLTRARLDAWAEKHSLVPSNYKNKKQVVKAIMQLWENHFAENPEFKTKYEIRHIGEPIPHHIPPRSEWNN